MQIESIEIKNYRLFRDAKLQDIPRLCVLVGANGTGKSTLFDVFSFLKDALAIECGQGSRKARRHREVASRGFAHEPIELTLQFRLEITGRERLVTYVLKIAPARTDAPSSNARCCATSAGSFGAPFRFLDFSRGKGYAITNEEEFSKKDEELTREEQELDAPDILAIKGSGQFERFKAASAFRLMIENWHISDFHVSEARPAQEDGFAEHLSTRGDNLPLVANYLFEHHPDRFDRVLHAMQRRVPGVSLVEPRQTEDGRLVLRFQDGSFKDPFHARFVSDGTIKMFAYLVLLNDPSLIRCWPWKSLRISCIPNCFRNSLRNSVTTPSAVARSSSPPTHRISLRATLIKVVLFRDQWLTRARWLKSVRFQCRGRLN